jgi:hypothetical protein
MMLDVSKVLVRFDGKPLMDVDDNGASVDATVRRALVNALLAPNQKDSGVQKIQKYELARRIYTTDMVEVSAEEVVVLKKQVEELYPPLVCGQLCAMLEGK